MLAGDRREGGAQRLEQRGPVGVAGRLAELGQQQREVAAQRADARQPAGMRAQVIAQRLHQRAVGRRAALHRGAAQHERARRSASTAVSRVLPTPASPLTSTVAPRPRGRAAAAPEALPLLRPADELRCPSGDSNPVARAGHRNTACRRQKYGNPAHVRRPRRP